MKFIWLPLLLLVSCSTIPPRVSEPVPEPAQAPATAATSIPAPEPVEVMRGVETIPDLAFARPGGVELLLDLHLPKGVKNPPLVMAIHGGGWKAGNRKSSKLFWIANHGYAVANIEYRMSTEAVFPAQIHDCKGALRWLRAHQDEYGYDASKVEVVGESAGGHLACLMGTSSGIESMEGTTAGYPDQSSTVQGVINYFGPSDFILRAESQPGITDQPGGLVYQLLGGAVSANPERARMASPVTYCDPGDPPILILHGDQDKQVLPDQSKRLLEVCRANNLEAHLHIEPGKGHGWKPPGAEEQKLVLDFLKKLLR